MRLNPAKLIKKFWINKCNRSFYVLLSYLPFLVISVIAFLTFVLLLVVVFYVNTYCEALWNHAELDAAPFYRHGSAGLGPRHWSVVSAVADFSMFTRSATPYPTMGSGAVRLLGDPASKVSTWDTRSSFLNPSLSRPCAAKKKLFGPIKNIGVFVEETKQKNEWAAEFRL